MPTKQGEKLPDASDSRLAKMYREIISDIPEPTNVASDLSQPHINEDEWTESFSSGGVGPTFSDQ